MIAFDQLTWLHGKPQSSGLLKANPEDFLVVEDLGFAPDGEGEHVLSKNNTLWENSWFLFYSFFLIC